MDYLNATQAASRLGVHEKTVRRWITEGKLEATHIKKNRFAIASSEIERLAEEQGKTEEASYIPILAELYDRIEALERELSKVRTTLASLTASSGNLVPPSQKTPRNASQRVDISNTLPNGLVVLRTFADMHGIPPTTALHNKNLPRPTGKWKLGRAYVTQALDAGGRAVFYELYSEQERFTPCPDCPHEEEKEVWS